jgi:hypothetical protein
MGKDQKDLKKIITEIRILIGIARQFCIARYSTLLYCLGLAFKKSGKDLIHILYILVIVILVFSSAIYFFETDSGLHILKEVDLWKVVDKSFLNGTNQTVFLDLKKIAAGNKSSHSSEYITKVNGTWKNETNNYTNTWTFTQVINIITPGNKTDVEVKLVDVTENNVLRHIQVAVDKDGFVNDSVNIRKYMKFCDSESTEEYEFQPILKADNKSIQLLLIEKYVALNLTSYNFTVESNSQFISIPASLWWGFITITTGIQLISFSAPKAGFCNSF